MPANLNVNSPSAPSQDGYSTLYNQIMGPLGARKLVAYTNEYGGTSYKFEGDVTGDKSQATPAQISDPDASAAREAKTMSSMPTSPSPVDQFQSSGMSGVAGQDSMGDAAASPGDAGVAGMGEASGPAAEGVAGSPGEAGPGAGDGPAGGAGAEEGGAGSGAASGSVGGSEDGSAFAEGGLVNKGKQAAPPVEKTPQGLLAPDMPSIEQEEGGVSNIPMEHSEPIMSLIDAYTAGDITRQQLLVELMGMMKPEDNVADLDQQIQDRMATQDQIDGEREGLLAKGMEADMQTAVGRNMPAKGYAHGGQVNTGMMQKPQAYAQGGPVQNPNTPGRVAVDPGQDMEDSIPMATDAGGKAKLNNGEYVIPAPAVRQIGVEKLNKIVQKAMQQGQQTEQIKPEGGAPGLLAPSVPNSPAAPKQAMGNTGMLSLPSSSRLPTGMSDMQSKIVQTIPDFNNRPVC